MSPRHLLLATALIAAASGAVPVAQRSGPVSGARRVVLSFQGRMRDYLLYVPAAPTGSLVLAFHGGGQTAAQMQQTTRFDALADREHFIVAYPEAFERNWADGRGVTTAEHNGVDDVGFARAVIADIGTTHTIDRARIFATGLSNGGILTMRLACDAADSFAAIAPVIATVAGNVVAMCHPAVPVAIVGVAGRADPSVSFDGGYVGGNPGGGQVQSVRATQEMWRSLNGCAPTVTSAALPVVVQDGTSIERRSYGGCRGHGDVVWYEIQGGGHRWPPYRQEGASEALALRENGVSSQNLNASEVIWAFFAAHGRATAR